MSPLVFFLLGRTFFFKKKTGVWFSDWWWWVLPETRWKCWPSEPGHCFGGPSFVTSSSRGPRILKKSCENEATKQCPQMSKRFGHHPNFALHIHAPIRVLPTNRLIWLVHFFDPFIDGFLVLLCNLLDQKCLWTEERCFGRKKLRSFFFKKKGSYISHPVCREEYQWLAWSNVTVVQRKYAPPSTSARRRHATPQRRCNHDPPPFPCCAPSACWRPTAGRARAQCTSANLASASRPPLKPRRPWASASPEPRENLRCTLLGAISWWWRTSQPAVCLVVWTGHVSRLAPSCQQSAASRPASKLSLDAIHPATVLSAVDGFENSLQLLIVKDLVHVGVLSVVIRRTFRSTAPLRWRPLRKRHRNVRCQVTLIETGWGWTAPEICFEKHLSVFSPLVQSMDTGHLLPLQSCSSGIRDNPWVPCVWCPERTCVDRIPNRHKLFPSPCSRMVRCSSVIAILRNLCGVQVQQPNSY